ncbi:MAG TPA: ATP-binding cassette domain-containing protein [Thermoanaerobaculia bacterium]|nr:ATP-binding cassette domain-containing protein [Thermoanaerobaculia bacterium]
MSVTLRNVILPLAEFDLALTEEFAARTTAICGPSGAGKTSLLEVMTGLRRPQSGSVSIGPRAVFDSDRHVDLPPRLRRVGYVPQDDTLFPHLSARGNMLYGVVPPSRRPAGRPEAGTTPEHVEEILEIGPLRNRSVQRLSGGERKRIALARALLSGPEILLLDEPLSGVHAELRGRVLDYLARIRDEFSIPIIYVTHEIAEASALCDEIVFLDRGRVIRRDILTA